MNEGELYERTCTMSRIDMKYIWGQYSSKFRLRPDGQESLLDVGCGTGIPLRDIFLPAFPQQQFARVVGADISESMLSYGREVVLNPNIEFHVLDVGSPLRADDTWTRTPFDHIISFYCLNWVQNIQQAMQNIYDLLTPNGDCLLVIVSKHPNFEFYLRLAENPRWAPYLTDVARFVPASHFSSDPAGDVERLMKEVGFSECDAKALVRTYDFGEMARYKEFSRSIFPFSSRFSNEQLELVMDDIGQILQTDYPERISASGTVVQDYTLTVVFARK